SPSHLQKQKLYIVIFMESCFLLDNRQKQRKEETTKFFIISTRTSIFVLTERHRSLISDLDSRKNGGISSYAS
ncbi:unnamed protein product, partial [Arabidopsis halleri]